MARYRDLKAWKHAQRLAVECSRVTGDFPDHEQAGLAAQLRRAAYSVPLSVAQGCVRSRSPDSRRHLETAQAALAEVTAILELAKDLGYVDLVPFARLEALADESGKMLYGLLRKSARSS